MKLPAIKGRFLWILLSIVTVASVVYAAAFHVTSLLQGPIEGVFPLLIYNVVIIAGYLAIYKLISDRYRSRPSSSVRVFWTPIVSGVLVLALGYYISRLGRLDGLESLGAQIDVLGFDLDSGRPLALATIFKMNVLTILQVVFAFLLLLGFRSLVLVKRTRASQRNWYLLVALMVVASASVFMKPARLDLTLIQRLALLPAVVFMVVNSIQLSWIAFLSFKEKLSSIFLSTILLAVLLLIGFMDEPLAAGVDVIQGNYRYMKHYSYPLSVFTSLTVIFGIIYSSTAFLSLLFHLPTTRAFRQKAGELAAMHSFSTLVGQVLERDKLYSTVVESPVSAEIADSGWLALADYSTGTLRPQVVSAISFERSEIEKMVDVPALFDELNSTRQPIHLEHAVADHRVKARPGDGLGSLFAIPLVARDECMGALFFAKSITRAFEPDDLEAITGFAAQAAMALDNSRLFAERLEKERLERELSIAREVQQ
ncbi:MAG: GAF domain-containing protein, partial [Rhodothermales bacterium]|nr:GAF domain-containing protein [Rhodothermales bacterium]